MFNDIYLDNGATTMLDPKVVKVMLPYLTKHYGNPSSNHSYGDKALEAIDKARKVIADSLNAKPENIFFTSGGTESNNWILKSVMFNSNKKHLITTKIEHKSVLNTCKWLEEQGYHVTYLGVNNEGFIDLEQLKSSINDNTALVSIIQGNNEIGTIQDLESIYKICQENNVLLHTDACQSYTKVPIKADFISLNAHKIHGPKGIGAIYAQKIEAWQHGGQQEFSLRAGTENVPAIVGFAEAVKLSLKNQNKVVKLRDKLIEGIKDYVKINGPLEKRLNNNVNFSIIGKSNDYLGEKLRQHSIACSTKSACSSKSLEPSYVLKAIGLSDEEANSSLRFTVSRFNTEKEIDYVIKTIKRLTQ
jgi:cysteine desulfurase